MLKKFLLWYLILLLGFGWGYAVVQYNIFPWKFVSAVERDVSAFIRGDIEESTRTLEKIANDLDLKPSRHLFKFVSIPDREYRPVQVDDLKSRRQSPEIFSSGQETPGYRVIYGIFDFSDSLHATLLLDQHNRVIHRWVVDKEALLERIEKHNAESEVQREIRPENRRLSLGLEVLQDGSLVINGGHGGNGIHRLSWCGELQWSQLGDFDHAVSLDPDRRTIWAFRDEILHEIDLESGEIMRQISIPQISRANPDKSVFTTRRLIYSGKTLTDPYHANDVEPLKAEWAAAFPQFKQGDLVVHLRSVNLVFIFNPDTLEIKWWRSGFSRLGHDPDWQPDGTLTMYDNNMRESSRQLNYRENYDGDHIRYSRILGINPVNFEISVLYDGALDNVYSKAKGSHQVLENGNIFLSSPHQGRVLEVDPQGQTVYEFVNRYDEEKTLIVTEVKWLPLDFFNMGLIENTSCPE